MPRDNAAARRAAKDAKDRITLGQAFGIHLGGPSILEDEEAEEMREKLDLLVEMVKKTNRRLKRIEEKLSIGTE